ncbi:hypothetical protein BN14_10996 [Rhizoctonia solani AG-1 IB]|uniref:Uncharacterized protein n=1 Tax=Thanatephorus cucumeris (strain AG1-IB / isolate 7/3/14) TaxID=1108050 RepID=M5CC23_THACB|nr:hypothetical protein BN14_10996 [Rhizoctonia solani AG-1 IB]
MTASFPYDFMHLIYENLVPNLIRHWTGTFKHLDQGSEHYVLTLAQWIAIGVETAAATRTTPGSFVGTLPDIAQDQSLYKAEAYGFWIQYIAPIVLKGRLSNKYYQHVLDLRAILDLCLQFEITMEQIDELELRIIRWVADYEAYYYQYKQSRASACPLTIHALLHIPYYIRQVGPVWASWAYVMERFCGRLLLYVKSHINPYPCIDNYILRRAQMQIITAKYNIPTIKIPPPTPVITAANVEISCQEKVYDQFTKSYPVDGQLMNQLVSYFQVVLSGQNLSLAELANLIQTDSIVRYGRVRIANGGDSMRTSDSIYNMENARNSSYVRFNMFPDRNTARRRADDDPFRQVNYGELLDIFYVELKDHGDPDIGRTFLLARVLLCQLLKWKDGSKEVVEYKEMESSPRIINLLTIESTIGRVQRHKTWGIIDRSRNAVRTLFTDDDNAPVY